jgi:hypothetical protein
LSTGTTPASRPTTRTATCWCSNATSPKRPSSSRFAKTSPTSSRASPSSQENSNAGSSPPATPKNAPSPPSQTRARARGRSKSRSQCTRAPATIAASGAGSRALRKAGTRATRPFPCTRSRGKADCK